MEHPFRLIWLAIFLSPIGTASAAEPVSCAACEALNLARAPFRIHGNTYYVGTMGLSSVLIVSDEGDVLIHGGLPESAHLIASNIEALGFHVEDVKLILNSHAHFDHAGGIADLQRMSGARVVASPWSAEAMRMGTAPRGDPQYGPALPFDPVADIEIIGDGEVFNIGPIAVTAHFTPGHTPGGTSWTWKSCEDGTCVDIVYADSLTAVSADDFYFTRSADYPNATADFKISFATINNLPCDILLSPHPGFTDLFEAQARGGADADPDAFVDADACRIYVASARENFERRIAREEAELGN